MERKLLLSEDLQNQVKLHHGIDEDPLSFQGFSRSLSVNLCVQICLEGGGHLDCEAALPAADRLLVGLPLVWPAGLRHIDVLLTAEALP